MWHDVENINTILVKVMKVGHCGASGVTVFQDVWLCENTASRDSVTASCCRPPDRDQHFHSHPNTDGAHNRLTEICSACLRRISCHLNSPAPLHHHQHPYPSPPWWPKSQEAAAGLEGHSFEFVCVWRCHGCKCTMNWIEIIKRQKNNFWLSKTLLTEAYLCHIFWLIIDLYNYPILFLVCKGISIFLNVFMNVFGSFDLFLLNHIIWKTRML